MHKLLTVGLLAAVAVPVLAQSTAPVAPVPPAPPVIHVAPMADKVVTRAEIDAKVRTHFTKLDANRDGYVTTAEVDARRAERKASRQAGGSGKAHAMNIRHGDPSAAFDRLDANRDGAISRDEFAKGREIRIEKRVIRDGAGAGEGHAPMVMRMHRMGGKRGLGGMGMLGGHLIKMADSNKDGRVSLAEATAGAMQHFDQADANRDGRITPDERRDRRVIIRQMHRPSAI